MVSLSTIYIIHGWLIIQNFSHLWMSKCHMRLWHMNWWQTLISMDVHTQCLYAACILDMSRTSFSTWVLSKHIIIIYFHVGFSIIYSHIVIAFHDLTCNPLLKITNEIHCLWLSYGFFSANVGSRYWGGGMGPKIWLERNYWCLTPSKIWIKR